MEKFESDKMQNLQKVESEQNKQINEQVNEIAKQCEELLVFSEGKPQKSISEYFSDFRKNKMEKSYHYQDRKSPEFQEALRYKFIEAAKKYIGVPYAKRHLKPEDPLYNSPIFLDCCALIRKAVWDLKEEFGFILGRWNQNYQYDMLSTELKFEEMKPGDLIFYSCEGYSHFQCHDMVHVEIFIGGSTGLATVGSRWTNAGVQIYDSYIFQSKKYKAFKYHYKSIQTWLEGVCKSWCPKHKWLDEWAALETDIMTKSKKFSIFNQEAEQCAEPDEEIENNDTTQESILQKSNTSSQAESKVKNEKEIEQY